MCRFINADGQLKFDGSIVTANAFTYCMCNPIKFVDDNGNEFRVVGAGVQLDASASVGPLGIGVGVEVIVYWDEVVTSGNVPIGAVYVYNAGNASVNLSDWQINSIKESVQPVVNQLAAMAGDMKNMSFGDIKNLIGSTSWGVTASGLVITGNEEFVDAHSYEYDFDTTTVSLWKVKGSHSVSSSCKSYGLGYTFVGSPQTYGWSYSHSYYRLLFTLFDEDEE